MPLVLDLSGGSQSPFLFNFGWRLGLVIGYAFFLVASNGRLLFQRIVLSLIWRRVFNYVMLFAIVGNFEFALFALSIRFIDVSVTTALWEIWPILFILLTARILKDEKRYRKINKETLLFLIVGFAGFAFVVVSQTGAGGEMNQGALPRAYLLIGVCLAILAAIATSFMAFSLKWGSDLSQELLPKLDGATSKESLDLFCVIIAHVVCSSLSAPVNATIGLLSGEKIAYGVFAVAIIGGIFTDAVATIAWRKSNLITNNLGINAMAYAIPVLSLLWLFVFSRAEVPRPDYLIMGAAAIITANLLINSEAEIRSGFKALLLALGTCGAIVYLRDGVFESLNVEQWHWTESGYFESITLAATVFTLLLAFRVARLVSRTSEEDNRTFIVYRKLDLLARRGIINPQVCDYILQIDQANNNVSVEQEAYTKARRLIADVDPRPLNEADSQLLSDAEANLDALARSKQVDIHLGEQFALGIFGAITVGLALLTLPPQVEGWTRLLVDLFAMLISAVIIFLLVHIQDLQRERDGSKLESLDSHAAYRNYLARFLDTRQRLFDQWLSFIVGGAIVLTYAALLAHKWVGWFG